MACGQIVNCLVENVLSLEEKAVGKISHSQLSTLKYYKIAMSPSSNLYFILLELVLKNFRVNSCNACSSGYCRQYPL